MHHDPLLGAWGRPFVGLHRYNREGSCTEASIDALRLRLDCRCAEHHGRHPVAVTNPCVSPRVKTTEPCARSATPVSIQIGRMSCVWRPSMRMPSVATLVHFFGGAFHAFFASPVMFAASSSSLPSTSCSISALRVALRAAPFHACQSLQGLPQAASPPMDINSFNTVSSEWVLRRCQI